MTDKHQERARALYSQLGRGSDRDEQVIATALRAAHDEGIKDAEQAVLDDLAGVGGTTAKYVALAIRSLKSSPKEE